MVVLGKGVVECEEEHPWREAAQGPLHTGIIAQAEGGCFLLVGCETRHGQYFCVET